MFFNIFKHFKTICKHKYWVDKYCNLAGIPWRGFKHDLSKFSPIEFWESVKYYQGTSSPIDASKKANGWSKAWQHHKGRNTHHFEYYWDLKDGKIISILMPYEDALEMLCDYLGAGRAYSGKNFTYTGELNWWYNKTKNPLMIHPVIKKFITYELEYFAEQEQKGEKFKFNNTFEVYNSFTHCPECNMKGYMNDIYK